MLCVLLDRDVRVVFDQRWWCPADICCTKWRDVVQIKLHLHLFLLNEYMIYKYSIQVFLGCILWRFTLIQNGEKLKCNSIKLQYVPATFMKSASSTCFLHCTYVSLVFPLKQGDRLISELYKSLFRLNASQRFASPCVHHSYTSIQYHQYAMLDASVLLWLLFRIILRPKEHDWKPCSFECAVSRVFFLPSSHFS